MSSPPGHRLDLVLPDGFRVVAAAVQRAVHAGDERTVDAQTRGWLDAVEAARAASEVLLVYADPWRGGTTVAALRLSTHVLEDSRDVVMDTLWDDALESTSTAGLVEHLALPQGAAVGTRDLAELKGAEPDAGCVGAVGLVEVHLPVATAGVLVTLTLLTPQPDLLAVYAWMTQRIAAGVRVDAVPGPAAQG